MADLIKTGKKAPQFSLSDKDGIEVSLKNLKADYTVLFFYPKDNTPGCTIESKQYSKDLQKFRKMKTAVFGISGGDQKTKAAFCKKHKLEVPLLSDTDFSVAKKYGVYGKKKFMGREFMGIFRVTFLLDSDKKVLKVYEAVSPETNSADVIKDILAHRGGAKKTTAKSTRALKGARRGATRK